MDSFIKCVFLRAKIGIAAAHLNLAVFVEKHENRVVSNMGFKRPANRFVHQLCLYPLPRHGMVLAITQRIIRSNTSPSTPIIKMVTQISS